MKTLTRSSSGNLLALPGIVSPEAMMDLVAEVDNLALEITLLQQSQDLAADIEANKVQKSSNLTLKCVDAKIAGSEPWKTRHVAILHMTYFLFWSATMDDTLAATILQLKASDFIFREVVFAILCLAAGGKYITTVKRGMTAGNPAFGFIMDKEKKLKSSEFFSKLGSGAHLQGQIPGIAPLETSLLV